MEPPPQTEPSAIIPTKRQGSWSGYQFIILLVLIVIGFNAALILSYKRSDDIQARVAQTIAQLEDQNKSLSSTITKQASIIEQLEKRLSLLSNDKQLAILKDGLDDLARRTVSPGALEASRKAMKEELQAKFDEHSAQLAKTTNDTKKLFAYISEQMYPGMTKIQSQVNELEKKQEALGSQIQNIQSAPVMMPMPTGVLLEQGAPTGNRLPTALPGAVVPAGSPSP